MAEKGKLKKAWKDAREVLAGGVNSPVRAFKAVGGDPVLMAQGLGPYLFDIEGRKYVDHCLSWGAVLLGHAPEAVVQAIRERAAMGTSFGTATEAETALARRIRDAFPSIERLRFTSSGTEAVMSALRLARGVTRRDLIVKFEGCYHGHADSLLVKAGSGMATLGIPDSAGVPTALAKLTINLPYNDAEAAESFLSRRNDIACVIVEPVAGNMGVVPGEKKFLETLRKYTRRSGSLLIFDEVITGFRLCEGGAQKIYGIEPDITTLGKIVGGGLPVGAFGAKADLMRHLAPDGSVYQAGTLSGNPLSMAAGLAVLNSLSESVYKDLNRRSEAFLAEARAILKKRHPEAVIQSFGSMFTPFFGVRRVRNWKDADRCDRRKFRRFFKHMLRHGIYIPPSMFEAYFTSVSHGGPELDATLRALKKF